MVGDLRFRCVPSLRLYWASAIGPPRPVQGITQIDNTILKGQGSPQIDICSDITEKFHFLIISLLYIAENSEN